MWSFTDYYDAELDLGLVANDDSPEVALSNTEILNLATAAMWSGGSFDLLRAPAGPILRPIRFTAKEFFFSIAEGPITTGIKIGANLQGYGSRGYPVASDQYAANGLGGAVTRLTVIDGDEGVSFFRFRGTGVTFKGFELCSRPYPTDSTGGGPTSGTRCPIGIEIEGRGHISTGRHIIEDCLFIDFDYGICCKEGYYPDNLAGTLTDRTSNSVGTLTLPSGHNLQLDRAVTFSWTASGGGTRMSIVDSVTSTTVDIRDGSGDNLPPDETPITVLFVEDRNHADTSIISHCTFWNCESCFRSENEQAIAWNLHNNEVSSFGEPGFRPTVIVDMVRGGDVHITGWLSIPHAAATVFRVAAGLTQTDRYWPAFAAALTCDNFKWDRFVANNDFYLTLFEYAGPVSAGDMSWIKWRVRISGNIGNHDMTEYDYTKLIVIPDSIAADLDIGNAFPRSDILLDIKNLPPNNFTKLGSGPLMYPNVGVKKFIAGTIANASSATVATTSAIDTTGANLIVVCVSSLKGTLADVSDLYDNAWTPLTPQEGASDNRCQLFYKFSPVVGPGHWFKSEDAAYPTIAVASFSGASINPFDQQNGTGTGTGTSVLPGSITPSEDYALVVAGVTVLPGTSININNDFTKLVSNSSPTFYFGGGIAYKYQTAAAAVNPTWTWTTPGEKCAVIASFN